MVTTDLRLGLAPSHVAGRDVSRRLDDAAQGFGPARGGEGICASGVPWQWWPRRLTERRCRRECTARRTPHRLLGSAPPTGRLRSVGQLHGEPKWTAARRWSAVPRSATIDARRPPSDALGLLMLHARQRATRTTSHGVWRQAPTRRWPRTLHTWKVMPYVCVPSYRNPNRAERVRSAAARARFTFASAFAVTDRFGAKRKNSKSLYGLRARNLRKFRARNLLSSGRFRIYAKTSITNPNADHTRR
ncbi:hypothetical protein SAMN05892883_2854 [Jatrophihabitans sp. GAS493]|nr:hypothetical protein SAMN05892883_2854 [Jatrophihabitans sp. GAS493]